MMKKLLVCCFAALCMVLSGCTGNQQEEQKTDPPAQEGAQQEVPDGTSEDLPQVTGQESPADPDSALEDDEFFGRWQAVETPQYYMDISSGDGGGYAIEIIWAGASRGDIVWLAAGTYDEIWEGIAYVGTKYEDVVKEDGSIERIPVPEREEVSGMVCLEDDGTLHWIDDFDHAGDDLSFEKE